MRIGAIRSRMVAGGAWIAMIRNALYQIAGIDRETLARCPATDKLWAAHLGFSLLLSFTVVLGITFHATGYVIANPWLRLLAAAVVALTVFMFDRALYQSDWFVQGVFRLPAGNGERGDPWAGTRRFFRIAIRLTISLGLAWVIAVFLELSVFSDTISEKTKRDHVEANRPVYAKIEQYEAQLAAEVGERRRNLAALEELQRRELALERAAAPPADDRERQMGALNDEIGRLDALEQELRGQLRQAEEKVVSYAQDMNAEELGQRINPASSGRAGAGPRYQFARRQKEVYEAQQTALRNELSQLRDRRAELTAQQQRLVADAQAQRERERAAAQTQRDALLARVEAARGELKELEAARPAKVEAFRREALAASDFQPQKDDPLSRMTAYQELKSDPKDGATITLFSWMTRFLVIFLEIVPVVAKMFFSPPSVYAAKIQAEVEREREAARLLSEAVRVDLEAEVEREREKARIAREAARAEREAKAEWEREKTRLAGEKARTELQAGARPAAADGLLSVAAVEAPLTFAGLEPPLELDHLVSEPMRPPAGEQPASGRTSRARALGLADASAPAADDNTADREREVAALLRSRARSSAAPMAEAGVGDSRHAHAAAGAGPQRAPPLPREAPSPSPASANATSSPPDFEQLSFEQTSRSGNFVQTPGTHTRPDRQEPDHGTC